MSESEYMELTRKIQSRIYKWTNCGGSELTVDRRKAKADEDIQILKIIEEALCKNMEVERNSD